MLSCRWRRLLEAGAAHRHADAGLGAGPHSLPRTADGSIAEQYIVPTFANRLNAEAENFAGNSCLSRYNRPMAFRPCIDLKDGRVVQIIGGTLTSNGQAAVNHVSHLTAADFAALYQRDELRGGHMILLGAGCEEAALSALRAYPGGLQVGGGITSANAAGYLDAGASHIIVTSFLFDGEQFSQDRLAEMVRAVGRARLVIDLSCRRAVSGDYFVATNRWQTVTPSRITPDFIHSLETSCAEFLVHAADVEGRQAGMDEDLVALLGRCVSLPTTYAGGARALEDIARVEQLSGGKLDLTIGSALDIFGGSHVRYADAARLGRRSPLSVLPR